MPLSHYLYQKICGPDEDTVEPIVSDQEEGIDDHQAPDLVITPSPLCEVCKPYAKVSGVIATFAIGTTLAFYYLITETTQADTDNYYGGDYDDSHPGDGTQKSLATLLRLGEIASAFVGAGIGLYAYSKKQYIVQGISNTTACVQNTFTTMRGKLCPQRHAEEQSLLPIANNPSFNVRQ